MNKLTMFGVVVAVVCALIPFATSRHLFFGAVNTKAFLILGAVLLLATIAATHYFSRRQTVTLTNRPLLWGSIGLLAVYWMSAWLGVFPERSFFSDIQRSSGVFFLTHITAFALLIGEFLRPRDWKVVFRTIAVSAAVYSFFTILGKEGFGLSGRIGWMNLDIAGFTFGNSTFAGTYLFLALAIALLQLVKTPRFTNWWYVLVGSAALIFLSPTLFSIEALLKGGIPLGSARASSAAAVLLLIFYGGYWLIRRYVHPITNVLPLWGGMFVVGVVGSVTLLFTPGSVVQNGYIEQSTGARIVVWESGVKAFAERPVLGWGSENYERAMQSHFNNRLFEQEFIGEIWFDRAHNVIVDKLVSTGVVGVLATLLVVFLFVRVVLRAWRRGVVSEEEAMLLFALPLAHFLQLQTGFDSIGSYMLLGVLGGYGLYLERTIAGERSEKEEQEHAKQYVMYYKVGAVVLMLLVLVSSYFLYAEFSRQKALYNVFVEQDPAKRLEWVETAVSRTSSFESLRFLSLSLVNGMLDQLAKKTATRSSVDSALEQLKVYEQAYHTYIAEQPDYYRARPALAYLLMVEMILGGENKLAEAKELVARGYELSPDNLLTPAIEAMLELYSGNVAGAKTKAEEAVALNRNAPFGREVLEHIEQQAETFPTISVLRLENL